MKKGIVLTISILVVSLFIGGAILYYVFNPSVLEVKGGDNYKGREGLLQELGDAETYMYIFPDMDINSINIKEYYCRITEQFMEDAYDVYLDYELDEVGYQKEKARIQSLSVSYKDKTQYIKKVEISSKYDTYVASWHKNRAYEYILFDDDSCKIICVYTQYHMPQSDVYRKEYLLEEDEIENVVGENFCMYWFKVDGMSEIRP